MYSVKPGRGPSLMGTFGGIAAAIFGVIWTVSAMSAGAPPAFALFGLLFIGMAIAGAIYNFYNATARNRMSTFDVTTNREESDPIADALGHTTRSAPEYNKGETALRQFPGDYCPFCGAPAGQDFDYCPKCGKDI